ncbi:MAG TPA: GAF domain-containing protein [Humisphaera sp.]|nr:GAF domain-containing protein [Humisphaera sp.]
MEKHVKPKRKETLLRLALKLVATERDLKEVLTAVVRMVEDQCEEAVGSIVLLDPDGKHVRHGAAPELPDEYNRAIDGVEIGPVAGSCGTAIHRREAVIVEDIATDPLWADYRDFALSHGLTACWSQPIFASDGQVLGSFAIYPKRARKPEPSELGLIESAAHLAGVAIERHRAEEAILRLNETLEQRVADRTAKLESQTRQLEDSEKVIRASEEHFKQLSERNRLLVQEVEHRVGNNLTGLIGLVSVMRNQTRDVDTFADAIDARLKAMAHVHAILTKNDWNGAELRGLAESTLEAMRSLAPHSVQEQLEGPHVPLDQQRAYALALILAEWFTNSCKYGAHSVAAGRLRIAWSIGEKAGGREVQFRWTERGGPPPSAVIRPSLGMLLVERFSSRELGGNCEMSFPPEGAEHVIVFPIRETPVEP